MASPGTSPKRSISVEAMALGSRGHVEQSLRTWVGAWPGSAVQGERPRWSVVARCVGGICRTWGAAPMRGSASRAMGPAASYCWHRPARIPRSLARVCDAKDLVRGRVIGVHHSAESKLGSYFAEGLEQAGLGRAAVIVATEAEDDAGLLKVTVALSSVADWKLRSEVHQVAVRVEDEHDATVLCFFQPLDPVPFAPTRVRAPKHAR